MKRLHIIALLLLCLTGSMQAQNEIHALRLSMLNPFGTARFSAQGGAIGALGGDLSAVQVNPAGLGFYRSSEFSLSPSFYLVNTETSFLGVEMDDSRLRFNLGNMGYVAARSSNRKSGFVGASFAFTYNTLANFNSRFTVMTGPVRNNSSSMLDEFTYYANAYPSDFDPFYEQVAADAGLLPYDSITGLYWNDFADGGYGQEQTRFVEQGGYIGEYAFSGAFNFSNLLYVGATFGIHSVSYYNEIMHVETDGNNNPMIDQFSFREYNSTDGWGYTFRMGMILRPIQLLRIGASVQIPTYYYLSDNKFTEAESVWDASTGWDKGQGLSPAGWFDYRVKAPMRANVHASVIIAKFATLSASYEFVDYSAARLSSFDDNFLDANEAIRRSYRDGHNLRTGAEFRFSSLYFRGGLQYLMSPYTDLRNDADQWIYSTGMGIRTRRAFFDLSYSRGYQTEVYGLYNPMNGAPETSYTSINEVQRNNLMITLGLRF